MADLAGDLYFGYALIKRILTGIFNGINRCIRAIPADRQTTGAHGRHAGAEPPHPINSQ